MAIDTNALTLGGSAPAKGTFQSRASGSSSNPVANDPNPDTDPTSQGGPSAPASQDSGSDTPVQTQGTGLKAAGPSAQTRTNIRATRAAKSTTPAGSAPVTATTVATAVAGANFGSVMASTLERSAATAAGPTVPTAPAATSAATDSGTTAAPPNAGAAADAVAWIAQVLTAPTTAAQAGVAASTGQAITAATPVGSITVATAGATPSATGAPGPALPTAIATAALRNREDAPSLPQAAAPPTTPVTAAAAAATQTTPAPAPDGINAMADVQKLISGMTTANTSGADPDGDENAPDAPPTHATTTASADGAQAAAALQASALTRTDTLGHASVSIQAPVGSAAFADEVSARVTGLAQSGITQAQLQLSPSDLGPVQVHITMQAGQASVWFGANHADTRAALEQSLPRLRELFAGAGMPLADSGVFREPPQQQQAQSLSSTSNARTGGNDSVSAPTVTQVSNIRLSLLDTYA